MTPGPWQRPLDTARTAKIEAEWDWAHFRPLVVARNGVDWLCDGMHTLDSMKRMDPVRRAVLGVDLDAIPARIVPVNSDEEAAALYVYLNTAPVKLPAFDLYKGQLAMKDPIALHVRDATTSLGLSIERKQDITSIAAVTEAKKLAARALLEPTLEYITTVWPYVPGTTPGKDYEPRTESAFLRGVAEYLLHSQNTTGHLPDSKAEVKTMRKREVSLNLGGTVFRQDASPQALIAFANQMVTENIIRGGGLLFGKDMGDWIGHALGRTVHTRKVWQTTFGGK